MPARCYSNALSHCQLPRFKSHRRVGKVAHTCIHAHPRILTHTQYLRGVAGVARRLEAFWLGGPLGNGPFSFQGWSFLVRINSGVCGGVFIISMSDVQFPACRFVDLFFMSSVLKESHDIHE